MIREFEIGNDLLRASCISLDGTIFALVTDHKTAGGEEHVVTLRLKNIGTGIEIFTNPIPTSTCFGIGEIHVAFSYDGNTVAVGIDYIHRFRVPSASSQTTARSVVPSIPSKKRARRLNVVHDYDGNWTMLAEFDKPLPTSRGNNTSCGAIDSALYSNIPEVGLDHMPGASLFRVKDDKDFGSSTDYLNAKQLDIIIDYLSAIRDQVLPTSDDDTWISKTFGKEGYSPLGQMDILIDFVSQARDFSARYLRRVRFSIIP